MEIQDETKREKGKEERRVKNNNNNILKNLERQWNFRVPLAFLKISPTAQHLKTGKMQQTLSVKH